MISPVQLERFNTNLSQSLQVPECDGFESWNHSVKITNGFLNPYTSIT